MCGVAVMGTISATAKATNAADAPLDAPLQLDAQDREWALEARDQARDRALETEYQDQDRDQARNTRLIFPFFSLALTVGVCYQVNKWHNEIKEAGKTPTCGVKSFLCCFFGGCGGLLTICQPIDEA